MATIPLMLLAVLYLVYRYLWEDKNMRKSQAAMYVGLGVACICALAGLASAAGEFMAYVFGSVLFMPMGYFGFLVGGEAGYRNAGRENPKELAEKNSKRYVVTVFVTSLVFPAICAPFTAMPYSFNIASCVMGIGAIIGILLLFCDIFPLEL